MATGHPLDRPVWRALTERQSHLARGGPAAVRLDPHYGPFAAPADASPLSLAALVDLIPEAAAIAVIDAADFPTPAGTRLATAEPLAQMTATFLKIRDVRFDIVPLTEDDAADMLALAGLTQPGPFAVRTHQLGDFVGVKIADRLVAMTGERMKPNGFTEVSAVCTHPDHRGQGYAAALTGVVAARILARGEIPFLHVLPHNTGAIAVYEKLGFALRRQMALRVLVRE